MSKQEWLVHGKCQHIQQGERLFVFVQHFLAERASQTFEIRGVFYMRRKFYSEVEYIECMLQCLLLVVFCCGVTGFCCALLCGVLCTAWVSVSASSVVFCMLFSPVPVVLAVALLGQCWHPFSTPQACFLTHRHTEPEPPRLAIPLLSCPPNNVATLVKTVLSSALLSDTPCASSRANLFLEPVITTLCFLQLFAWICALFSTLSVAFVHLDLSVRRLSTWIVQPKAVAYLSAWIVAL